MQRRMDPHRAFEEVANYVRTNMKGGVTHYIQRALNAGEHYSFALKVPLDPTIGVATNTERVEETMEIRAST